MNLDDVRKLHQRKFRDLLGHFLVEGEHLVLELQKAARIHPALLRSTLYVTQHHADWKGPFETHVVTDARMARLADTRTPQGIIAVVPVLPAPAPRAGEKSIYLQPSHQDQSPTDSTVTYKWRASLSWTNHAMHTIILATLRNCA